MNPPQCQPWSTSDYRVGTIMPLDRDNYGGFYQQHLQQLVTASPTYCTTDSHLFGCQRALKCKCGKATRLAPVPPNCTHCGEAHT